MKYVDEFRSADAVKILAKKIEKIATRPSHIMEVCGGQTNSFMKYGLNELLPKEVKLLHGPGCPVCVTPLEIIDQAILIAQKPQVIFCSFGDMLRVPGSQTHLFAAKASGADIRTVYSPLDAVKIAEENPHQEVVFFAIGFETTAPANAMALFQALRKDIKNFSILVSHFLVPPAIETIMSSDSHQVHGFLAAGHVCTVMGYEEYIPLVEKYKIPIVVTGFEPVDLLEGLYLCIKQREEGRFEVENQYARSVTKCGNLQAQEIVNQVFERRDQKWRGIGEMSSSGLRLKGDYKFFDAQVRFEVGGVHVIEESQCISGAILQGQMTPYQCVKFKNGCSPENPLGALMVSAEGACAAYYKYGR